MDKPACLAVLLLAFGASACDLVDEPDGPTPEDFARSSSESIGDEGDEAEPPPLRRELRRDALTADGPGTSAVR
jgi:hypothetical protein